jgi:hypothetical protein
MANSIDKQGRAASQVPTGEAVQRAPGKSTLVEAAYAATASAMSGTGAPVQRKGDGSDPERVHAAANAGVAGPGGSLPFGDRIQSLFGAHDVTEVRAHTGPEAAAANASLGSTAYATGNDIAFAGAPDLHTAAHEAAHVVQQRGGVQLKGGVGEAGDTYERHADAVADKVVQGQSAESLLSAVASTSAHAPAGASPVQHKALQFLGTPLDQSLPSGAEAPAFGEDKGDQRRYSVEQYVAMWEKEQGRKMTASEKETIERGCIGITANNLQGKGNPLNFAEGTYGTFEQAHAEMKKKNDFLDTLKAGALLLSPLAGLLMSKSRYVLFAQLFWSNQAADFDARSKPDPKAYLPDAKTGEIDMSDYKYRPRTKDDGSGETYVNFDYGFWDEASQCFWHANHMRYKDPAKNAAKPMEVFQSTKEHFIAGYKDFDRAVFCIAKAENYDPGLAAISHAGAH